MAEGQELFTRALSLAVHELRTPITVTAGYLRMLIRDQAGPLSEKQRKMIEEAERSCARITTLISEMSDLGKLHAGEITVPTATFDLSAVMTDVAKDMHEGEDRGIRLEVRAPQPVTVSGDRTRLAAALKALVHAALRERGEAGVILADCSALDQALDGANARWALVTIGDASATPSLAASGRDATPPPFDEWRGGMGLALPVGRRVIEAHGGAIWSAAPNARAGSGFRLPAAR